MRISEEGAEKGGEESEAQATALGGGGRGAPLTHFSRRPLSGPRATRVEGRALRGRASGAWEARTLPTPSRDPGDGSVRGGSARPLGVPAAGESSRRPAARTCTAPAAAWAEGAAAPSGGEGDRGGEEAVNSPSVRASPRRAPLPRPRRSRAGPQPAPGPPVPASGRPGGGPVASPEGSGSSRSGPSSREGGSQDLPVITFYAILDPLVNVPTKHYG